ncbi:hypothetical protein [Micromonospora ureilytica]|uniref:hypothetical protein n=1 Tax=Micromonospora ureilytica TaxID=709868 RepID=UPI002E10ACB7|nr:hypothetical protein OHB55_31850 [Micromonospora ureilytica]
MNDTTFNLAYVLGVVLASRFIPDDGRSPALLGVAAVGFGCLAVGYAVAGGRWARETGIGGAHLAAAMTVVER